MNKWIKQQGLCLLVLYLGINLSAQAGPNIQHWQTRNGAKVYYVHAPELSMVDIRVIFDAGSAKDGELPGKALMTNGLLEEGAGKMDADQIADRFASVGAKFGASAHRDMAIASLRTLTQPDLLATAVDTMATVLHKPTFPKKALERERKRLLVAIQGKKQSPGDIAQETFFAALYDSHPYATDSSGTEESVKKISRKDLVNHYKRYYVGRNAIVAIVGAVDKTQAEKLAETVVGQLPAGEPAEPTPEVPPLAKATVIKKTFPSSQTHLLVGQPGMSRGDPDYFPLYVGNHILGGSGLVSILTDEIREKRGLAYSSYSYFSPMRQNGPFIMGLQTRNDQAKDALELLKKTLAEYIKRGPSAKELKAAKQNITGGFALNLDSNGKIVEYIAMIGFYQLPLDYLDTFTDKVEAVSEKQIRDAFKRRLQPDVMVTVTVGGETS